LKMDITSCDTQMERVASQALPKEVDANCVHL